MKKQSLILLSATILGLLFGFWLYGIGRTMCETVNFTKWAALKGSLLGAVFPLIVAIILVVLGIALFLIQKSWAPRSALFIFGVALIIGNIISEWWILQDEARFIEETRLLQSGNLYSRPRVWPNQSGSLIFVPGKGIHAND